MRIILFLGMVLSLLKLKAPDNDEFLKKCLYPTVTVINPKSKTTGTAFVIRSEKIDDKNYINISLSCNHVVSPKMLTQIHSYSDSYFYDSETTRNSLTIGSNKENDISVIMFLSNEKLKEASISYRNDFKLREKVFIVGCGLTDSPRFSEGVITQLSPNKQGLKDIRTSVCMVPGDSGSALFDEKNNVIGIANSIKTMGHDDNQFPVTNISVFKSIRLYKSIFTSDKYDFIYEKKKLPVFLADYLWLSDSEYGI